METSLGRKVWQEGDCKSGGNKGHKRVSSVIVKRWSELIRGGNWGDRRLSPVVTARAWGVKWYAWQKARYKPRIQSMSAYVGHSSGCLKTNGEYNLREKIWSSAYALRWSQKKLILVFIALFSFPLFNSQLPSFFPSPMDVAVSLKNWISES